MGYLSSIRLTLCDAIFRCFARINIFHVNFIIFERNVEHVTGLSILGSQNYAQE
jgi:hypothetical protein